MSNTDTDVGPIDVDEAAYVCRLCGDAAIYWPGFCSPCYPEWQNRGT